MIRVGVFPCGSEIALEVYRALKDEKDIELIGISSVEDHGKFVFENYIGEVPYANSPNFISSIQKIVEENNIDFIYPCMDIVMPILKKNEDFLNCKVITSPIETVEICLSKKKTYEYLKDFILVPQVFSTGEIVEFPVFSKPEVGASSRNTFKINDETDLFYYTKKYPGNLLLEYLPGEEYTVDCFTDSKGNLIYCSPRLRSRIVNGISVNTKLVKDEKIKLMAESINKKMVFSGSWFFQIKRNIDNDFCLMEVATRFGGSSVIQRYRGVNFPLLNLYLYRGFDIQIEENEFEIEIDRGLDIKGKLNIEFGTVYIDLDDTIIVKDKVNSNMMKLIYYFLNIGKKIILISKHKENIYETLQKYKIDKTIFSQIIHISKEDEKYKYMSLNSIFIDDSFTERKKVKNQLNIPTFSVDTINIFYNGN